jgi:hypothetical protein
LWRGIVQLRKSWTSELSMLASSRILPIISLIRSFAT